MSHAKAIEITDDNFDAQAMQSALPVLIDFTATWCPPCRAIAPHVEAIANAYEGRVRVGTCDVDANPELTAKLDVRSMPTLMMFKQGQVVGQIVGAVPRAKIEALVARALG
jgi:thioredoxin 1